jgi:hypothetical protein
MKRLNYLDYVKTPESWKAQALEIPNHTLEDNLSHKKTKKIYKPSVILVACIVALSVSGIGVYAYESGAFDTIKSQLFEDTINPYNYDGVANDYLDTSALDNDIVTDISVENLVLSRDDMDFKVTGYISDRNVNFVTVELILPEGETFSNPKGTAIFNFDKSDIVDNVSGDPVSYGIYSSSVEDNVVYVTLSLVDYIYSDDSYSHNYHIELGDLGSYLTGEFVPEHEFDLSFDLQLQDCNISKRIDNLDIPIHENCSVDSVSYSPLELTIYFENTGDTWNCLHSQDFSIYYIYDDGRKVFIPRDSRSSGTTNDWTYNYITVPYALNEESLIDFTHIVALEIDGKTVPLQ